MTYRPGRAPGEVLPHLELPGNHRSRPLVSKTMPTRYGAAWRPVGAAAAAIAEGAAMTASRRPSRRPGRRRDRRQLHPLSLLALVLFLGYMAGHVRRRLP